MCFMYLEYMKLVMMADLANTQSCMILYRLIIVTFIISFSPFRRLIDHSQYILYI